VCLVVQQGLFKVLKVVDNLSKEMDDKEKERFHGTYT